MHKKGAQIVFYLFDLISLIICIVVISAIYVNMNFHTPGIISCVFNDRSNELQI